ncbi:hypothetical protein [Acinetobacter pittii]|uniref:hypothetical protein n=1 Tax=Acinetobacter pittii TaxID=48296 RepID=UPI001F36847F|nr:hypothetical protein [Acinetobacter pittii]MCE6235686.1 hypothetical protein [Acinetobacter pittii]MCE6691113.1 hypothetical protein [Acinetobacter pittii]MCE6698565.1 hypothetical protein [Acinetobacter pittii]MCU4528250.1 hypothetical protein [Acinetobacter pittii]
MKTLFRRSLTTLMCAGALIIGTQSWAGDAKQPMSANTESKTHSKADEKCSEPCCIKNEGKIQHSNKADMSKMDHSKMSDMDHSKMMDMSKK